MIPFKCATLAECINIYKLYVYQRIKRLSIFFCNNEIIFLLNLLCFDLNFEFVPNE